MEKLILGIILILPALGASHKGILVPEKVVKPLVIIVPNVQHSRAGGHRGTIKTDEAIGHPVWYNQLMTKYLSDTYGISSSDTAVYSDSSGSSMLINPYVLQPLSGKQRIKQNQRLYQSKGK